MDKTTSSASHRPVAQAGLSHADAQKRFAIELFTGKSVEHWQATNAALKATAAVRPATR